MKFLRRFIAICTTAMTLFLSGCASVDKFVSYRPSGSNASLGIEVISLVHTPPVFELKIDGQHVMELPWTMFNHHVSASGSYRGKPIEMKGTFIPGGTYIVDVFIGQERAANFTFP